MMNKMQNDSPIENVIGSQFLTIDHRWSKTHIQQVAQQFIREHLDGNSDAFTTAEILAKIEFLLKEIRSNKDFVDYVVDELSKRGENGSIKRTDGTKIETIESGVKYDYSVCNDSMWVELRIKKDEIEQQMKNREEFLKKIPQSGMKTIDESTGEMVELFPPNKTSTTSFKVTIAK
jgi:hypothetical protein